MLRSGAVPWLWHRFDHITGVVPPSPPGATPAEGSGTGTIGTPAHHVRPPVLAPMLATAAASHPGPGSIAAPLTDFAVPARPDATSKSTTAMLPPKAGTGGGVLCTAPLRPPLPSAKPTLDATAASAASAPTPLATVGKPSRAAAAPAVPSPTVADPAVLTAAAKPRPCDAAAQKATPAPVAKPRPASSRQSTFRVKTGAGVAVASASAPHLDPYGSDSDGNDEVPSPVKSVLSSAMADVDAAATAAAPPPTTRPVPDSAPWPPPPVARPPLAVSAPPPPLPPAVKPAAPHDPALEPKPAAADVPPRDPEAGRKVPDRQQSRQPGQGRGPSAAAAVAASSTEAEIMRLKADRRRADNADDDDEVERLTKLIKALKAARGHEAALAKPASTLNAETMPEPIHAAVTRAALTPAPAPAATARLVRTAPSAVRRSSKSLGGMSIPALRGKRIASSTTPAATSRAPADPGNAVGLAVTASQGVVIKSVPGPTVALAAGAKPLPAPRR